MEQQPDPRLLAAFEALSTGKNLQNHAGIITAHPVLLSPQADLLLTRAVEVAMRDPLNEHCGPLQDLRSLLREAREYGLDSAIAAHERKATEMESLGASDQEAVSKLTDLLATPSEQRDPDAFVQAASFLEGLLQPPLADLPDVVLLGTSQALEAIFATLGDRDALARAIEAQHVLVQRSPLSLYTTRLARYAELLLKSFYHAGHAADLDSAVEAAEKVLANSKRNGPYYPHSAMRLSAMLADRYQFLGSLRDLERALQISESGTSNTTAGSPELILGINQLAWVSLLRHSATHDSSALERSIRLWQKTIDLANSFGPNSPDLPVVHRNLALGLHSRHKEQGCREDLDSAIDYAEKARASSTSPGARRLASQVLALCVASRARYTGVDDFERALGVLEKTLEDVGTTSPVRYKLQAQLAQTYASFYSYRPDSGLLDAALESGLQALSRFPKGSPDHLQCALNVARDLRRRFLDTGHATDLKRAESLVQSVQREEALSETLSIQAEYERLWIARLRAVAGSDPRELALALSHGQELLDCITTSTAARVSFACLLGVLAVDLYVIRGSVQDLDQAIDLLKPLSRLEPDGSDLPATLGQLLLHRFDALGTVADLEAAVALYGRASRGPLNELELRPAILNNLALAHLYRHSLFQDHQDLELAIGSLEEALEIAGDRAGGMAITLDNYSKAKGRMFRYSRNPADLDASVSASQAARSACKPSSTDLPMVLSNLGGALLRRYLTLGSRADLETAISVTREASDICESRSSMAGEVTLQLASALRARHEITQKKQDQEAAREAFALALTRAGLCEPNIRLAAAAGWGDWEYRCSNWNEAVEAYNRADEPLDHLIASQADRLSKEAWLVGIQGLSQRHAHCLAMLGRNVEAVEVLEKGLCRVLSEALGLRHDLLSSLESERQGQLVSELAMTQREIRGLLRRAELTGFERQHRDSLSRDLAEAHGRLRALVGDIQRLPGYSTFGRALSIEQIQKAADRVPLVYLASTSHSGYAFVLRGALEPTLVDLPGIAGEPLQAHLLPYVRAYAGWRSSPQDPVANATWRDSLTKLCAWLWDSVVSPLLPALTDEKEVLFIPAGLLNLLPLHAAWCSDSTQLDGRRYLIDRMAIRYSPNIRALRGLAPPASRPAIRATLIGDPASAEETDIPGALDEIRAVQARLVDAKTLVGADATPAAALRALASSDVAHFACHAISKLESPLESAFLLADGSALTLRELLSSEIGHLRLAVLSACETAMPGARLPDEHVSLATGLLECGASAVVASSWAVEDVATASLMKVFYDFWQGKGLKPSFALRQAQIALRTGGYGDEALNRAKNLAHPFYWAAFRFLGS